MPGREGNHEELPVKAIVEAALFLSHEPLSLNKLSFVAGVTAKEVKQALEELGLDLEKSERGLTLLEQKDGYQLGTKPAAAPYVEKLFSEDPSSMPLSRAALETLAVIAVKQPVTRLEVEKIRGVKAEGVIDNLLKRGLIRINGRREGLGRPFLYGTTGEFLKYFGLKDLSELKELKNELDSLEQ